MSLLPSPNARLARKNPTVVLTERAPRHRTKFTHAGRAISPTRTSCPRRLLRRLRKDADGERCQHRGLEKAPRSHLPLDKGKKDARPRSAASLVDAKATGALDLPRLLVECPRALCAHVPNQALDK